MTKIFDTCITPILLYGSEVWGPLHDKNWDTSPIEMIHTQFLKRLLGVNRSTTSLMARSEMGRHSLLHYVTKRNINFLKYIDEKGQDTLVNQAANYELTQSENRDSLFNLLTKYDRYPNIEKLNIRTFDSVIRTEFDRDWSTNIATYSKADTFKEFKSHMRLENYLTTIKSRKQRVSFCKFRLSDHCLMIEKARHQRVVPERQQRVCPFCPTEMEDEVQ